MTKSQKVVEVHDIVGEQYLMLTVPQKGVYPKNIILISID